MWISLAKHLRWSSSVVHLDRLNVGFNGSWDFFDLNAVSKDVVRPKYGQKWGVCKKSTVGCRWISQEWDHFKPIGWMCNHDTIHSYLLDINSAQFRAMCECEVTNDIEIHLFSTFGSLCFTNSLLVRVPLGSYRVWRIIYDNLVRIAWKRPRSFVFTAMLYVGDMIPTCHGTIETFKLASVQCVLSVL